MRRIHLKSIHSFLLSVYPVIALFANNLGEVDLKVIYRPLLVCMLFMVFVYIILFAFIRNEQRTGLITSLIVIIFFTYGHVYQALSGVEVAGKLLRRHRILLPITLLIAGGAWWYLQFRLKSVSNAVLSMNLFALILLLLPLIRLTTFYMKIRSDKGQIDHSVEELTIPGDGNLPDIYYIILDSYVRNDILLDYYGFDNTQFTTELETMGFYISECSKSNYMQTELSLPTSLNYRYLDDLGEVFEPGSDRTALSKYLQNSAVRLALEEIGYSSFAFETGYSWSQVTAADHYLKPNQGILNSSLMTTIKPFESMLFKSTFGLVLVDFQNILPGKVLAGVDFPYQEHVDRQIFLLGTMAALPNREEPKFVFAHMIVPHPPFVFQADGSIQDDADYYRDSGAPINDEIYRLGYIDQVQFINRQITAVVDRILSTSMYEPIIIIQADHGDGLTFSPAILNAYYLPGDGADGLYPSISPVNTFRLILSEYFGADLPLLDDISRVSTYEKPFDFILYEDPNPLCE